MSSEETLGSSKAADEEAREGSRFPDLRADFIRHLSICRDEDLLLLVFAQNALQLGQTKIARLILRHGFPDHFVNAKLPDTRRANEWELETIVNELLTTSRTYISTADIRASTMKAQWP